jgi:queuine tRNA-ribosyltransferase
MCFNFKVEMVDKVSLAKAGVITTPHGKTLTPCFSPVATMASVRDLPTKYLIETKTQVILGNTYHLYFKPRLPTIKKFGGFANFQYKSTWKVVYVGMGAKD